MLDTSRDRFSHLVASAILELWKKETGSSSPVVIEGTICITGSSGVTTVIQVAEKFASISQEYFENSSGRLSTARRGLLPVTGGISRSDLPYGSQNGADSQTHATASNPANMAAYLDDLSPASLVSPPAEGSHSSANSGSQAESGSMDSRPSSRSPEAVTSGVGGGSGSNATICHDRNNNSDDTDGHVHDSGIDITAMDQSESVDRRDSRAKQERERDLLSRRRSESAENSMDRHYDSDSEEMVRRNDTRPSVGLERSRHDASAGYFSVNKLLHSQEKHSHTKTGQSETRERGEVDSESILDNSGMDTTGDFSINESHPAYGPFMSTPKDVYKFADRGRPFEDESPALDLSRREPDDGLALSPPHSYTTQVRNVIRQRLLAQKFSLNQLKIEEQPPKQGVPISASHSFSGEAPVSPVRNTSESSKSASEDKSPQVSDSLPSTPASAFPLHPLLSPGQTPSRFLFPYAPFAQHPNLLYAEHIQNLMQRSLTAASLVPHSPQPPQLLERPSSEPSTPDAHSPTVSDRLSHSFDGRRTPQATSAGQSASGSGEQQKVYSCDYCHKTFLFKSKYHEHLPVHTNARPYQCRICSRTYKYKYDLRVHLRTHLGIPTKSTLCPFCNAKFETNKMLRQHIKEAHRDHHKVLSDEQLQMFDAV